MNTEARQVVSIIASAAVGAGAATLLVGAPSPSGKDALFLTLSVGFLTFLAVGWWLVVAALFARGAASTNPNRLTSRALVASGYSVPAAGFAYHWPTIWVAVLSAGFFVASLLFRLRAISTEHASSRASAQL